jgi:hypothetical protein
MRRRKPDLTPPDPAPLPVSAARPLAITEDDRDILVGFNAQRTAAVATANETIQAVNARQAAYLARLAVRLGVDPAILARCRINEKALTLEPIA